jgi:hypothetical protein
MRLTLRPFPGISLSATPLSSPFAQLRRLLGRLRRRVAWTTGATASDETSRKVAELFDAAHYRAHNPDVAAAGVDPVAHFLAYGWREGRDPRPDFSLADYRELNGDVVGEDDNPFIHYVLAGRAEGRIAKRSLGFRHDIIARLGAREKRLIAPRAKPIKASASERLAEALATSRSGLADLHLSVSHDNYAENIGGVQLCVLREARGLAADGVDHLHLFPAQAHPMLRDARGGLIGVLWNGALVGHFGPAAIVQALAGVRPARRTFALHNLLGHSASDILEILQAADLETGFFWIHDFASLCAGFHLMRNDVADCGAPPPDSGACTVCVYGPHRAFHVAEHRALFEALKLTVVAPSQSALDLWRGSTDLPHVDELLAPHARLGGNRPATTAYDGPLRVAFVGVGAPHKGWPVFEDLVAKFRDDRRYAFVHLGRKGPHHLPVEFHEVTVTADQPNAMRDALETHAIDVALVWPLCRETFSFTAFEAAAAGAAVLTHPDSGNVAAFVAEGGHGRVLADEAALGELFESGEAVSLSRATRKPKLRELTFGALTAELRTGELRAGPEARPSSARR